MYMRTHFCGNYKFIQISKISVLGDVILSIHKSRLVWVFMSGENDEHHGILYFRI